MKTCAKCGARVKRIKTQVTKEMEGRSMTFVDIPAYQCENCGNVTLKRPQDFDDLGKDKSDLAVGIFKLYYTNRPLFYLVGVVIFLLWVFATYLFFF
ncbi:MAG: YgiT-type zinc finger protein [Nitrospiraceae bacterium]